MDARSKAHEGGTAEVQQAQASGRAGSRRGDTAAPALSATGAMEKTTSPVPVTGAQLVILTDDITKQLEWSAMPEF